MGTRSTMKFYSYGRLLLSIYNQTDGYIKNGYGEDLIDFLKDKKNHGNGFEDTCLLYLLRIKKGAMGTYATCEDDMQEYNYVITEYNNKLYLRITYQAWENYKDTYKTHYLELYNGLLENANVDEIETHANEIIHEFYDMNRD